MADNKNIFIFVLNMELFPIATRKLLALNGILWLIIGAKILATGVSSYVNLIPDSRIWWLVMISAVVFVGFFFMFRKVESKYSARILSFKEKRKSVFCVFSLQGYLLVAFMMGLGIAMSHVSGVTDAFYASFYTGLGCGLVSAGIRFFLRWMRTGVTC